MNTQVAVLAGVAGLAATPLVLVAARWAPRVARPEPPPDRGWPRAPVIVAVAIVTAAVLGLVGARIGADPALAAFGVFSVVGVTLVLIDLAEHRLPDVLTLPSYAVGVVLLGVATALGSDTGSLGRALLGAVIALAVFTVLWLVAPTGIGFGDVKYAGVVGLHAAWLGWGPLFIALVGGFVVGGVVSLLLLVSGRVGLRSRVPFGPAMIVGALIGIVVGEPLASAWLGW